EAVEPVRDRRAGRAPRRVVGPEHEVVDEKLRAASEEVCQRGAPLVGVESIRVVDPNPRQLLPPPRQLVAAPRELLLRLEQLEPGCKPFFTCPGHVLRHRSSLLVLVHVSLRRGRLSRRMIPPRCGTVSRPCHRTRPKVSLLRHTHDRPIALRALAAGEGGDLRPSDVTQTETCHNWSGLIQLILFFAQASLPAVLAR